MTPLLKKLNFKEQKDVLILNHPLEFETELDGISGFANIKTDINSVDQIEFVLTFITTKAEIDTITPLINKKLKGDGIVWFAYPKGTSKKYRSEINRDNGWEILANSGFESVRQIAIDEDWSALRFRKVEFIKVMKRRMDFAKTAQGQLKTKNSR